MSFILDALKKSESDRQRQSGPALFEVKVAPPRRALPVWAIAIAVLLADQRHRDLVDAAAAPRRAAAGGGSVPAHRARSRGSGGRRCGYPAGPGAATASGQAPGSALAAAAIATPPPVHSGSSDQTPAPASRASSGQNAGQSSPGGNPSDDAPAVEPGATPGFATSGGGQAGGEMPLYQQIVTSDNLPPLHLDMHVFADRPQDRFVLINMHRLGEGDTLPGGVHVDAIRPDGVVLTYQGTQFLLPRN